MLATKIGKNEMTVNIYLCNSFWSVLTLKLDMGQSYVQVKTVIFCNFSDNLAYTICKLVMLFERLK